MQIHQILFSILTLLFPLCLSLCICIYTHIYVNLLIYLIYERMSFISRPIFTEIYIHTHTHKYMRENELQISCPFVLKYSVLLENKDFLLYNYNIIIKRNLTALKWCIYYLIHGQFSNVTSCPNNILLSL